MERVTMCIEGNIGKKISGKLKEIKETSTGTGNILIYFPIKI